MPSYRFSALLASAALVVGAALVPASASADDTTPAPGTPTAITTTDLVTALTAAKASTAAAEAAGWALHGTADVPGYPTMSLQAIYAVDRGLTDVAGGNTMIEAQHAGTYVKLSGSAVHVTRTRLHQALKAVKKPHATWVFLPDGSLDVHSSDGSSLIGILAPDAYLGRLADPTHVALTGTPTRTDASGSTTYTYAGTNVADPSITATGSFTVDANGVLASYSETTPADTETGAFTYGTQSVALPARSATVTMQQLTRGLVLATLPQQVKLAAKAIARAAIRGAHGHTVRVAAVRSYAARILKSANRDLGAKIFSSRATGSGVRVTGTNRSTHAHTSYTVAAAGKKAVVRRG